MTARITKPNIAAADEFYELLLARHDGLSKDASIAFNARLILVMANHIGDMDILTEAMVVAAKPSELPKK